MIQHARQQFVLGTPPGSMKRLPLAVMKIDGVRSTLSSRGVVDIVAHLGLDARDLWRAPALSSARPLSKR
jgi:hypothetical protein